MDTYITAFECPHMGAIESANRSTIEHTQHCTDMDTVITTVFSAL